MQHKLNREYIIAANWFKYRIALYYTLKQWEPYYMASTSSKIPKLNYIRQIKMESKDLEVPRTPLSEKETLILNVKGLIEQDHMPII